LAKLENRCRLTHEINLAYHDVPRALLPSANNITREPGIRLRPDV